MLNKKNKGIYLDYMATTPVDARVQKAMEPYWSDVFAHPWAIHSMGVEAREVFENAQRTCARFIDCRPEEIIFTGNGTESSTQALVGYLEAQKEKGEISGKRIILSAIEHPSVGGIVEYANANDLHVDIARVNEAGIVDTDHFKELLSEDTLLVSILYVNSEIGTIQPIQLIGRAIEKYNQEHGSNIIFHTDASQAALYLPCDATKLRVDMMTLDAHKMYGPKGVGALYVRKDITLKPILLGLSTKSYVRHGTPAMPLIVGFAKAFEIAQTEQGEYKEKVEAVRDYFFKEIEAHFPKARINGDKVLRAPHNVSVTFPGENHEFIVVSLDMNNIYTSTRSACTQSNDDPSATLQALFDHRNPSAVRFSLGKETTKKDVDTVIKVLQKILKS